MCFGSRSTNPKVASGADNHDQSHRALSYDLSEEIHPNRVVLTDKEREHDLWANTRFPKDNEGREAAAAPVQKRGYEGVQRKKGFTFASNVYSTL